MFGFRKKTAPKPLSSNPGIGVSGKVAFSNAERNWTERFDVVASLASVLKEEGHAIQKEESWLVHKDSGFILIPQLASFQPSDKGGVRTTTTIQTHHPALVPDGVFEYQHSNGDSIVDSIRNGFDQWTQTDLVTLVDALLPKPKTCTTLNMTFPEKEGKPAYSRRAVLGPVAHFVQNPQIHAKREPGSTGNVLGNQCESHEFCPCCLLSNSIETFKELIEGAGFYALRLFASRDGNETPQADCRVNGEDWEKGADALRKYVTTWPGTGIEFRKQSAVLHTVETKS